jgi:hypothetical protein
MSYYVLEHGCAVHLPRSQNAVLLGELLSGYTQGNTFDMISDSTENVITIGSPAPISSFDLGASCAVVEISEKGIAVVGADAAATVRGFITVLEKIEYDRASDSFRIPVGHFSETPQMAFRGVHLCLFPETSLHFIKKCIRACGIAKYSHIVFEFWGMLKMDCMAELAWPFAHTKEEIRPLIEEARSLGMEIIPMFNHLGHASANREIYGKHVVLDQNPKLEYLFTMHGWEWNFESAEVCELLARVRAELIELCGEGSYFHLGCDEAYSLGYGENRAEALCRYLNGIAAELRAQGRRAIIWGDMLLLRRDFAGESQKYSCNMENEQIWQTLLDGLDRDIIIADWQYHLTCDVWKSSVFLKDAGFDVLCCPWDTQANARSAIHNVSGQELLGLMYTTWHTLAKGFPIMLYAGRAAYSGEKEIHAKEVRFSAAEVARRVLPAQGVYEDAGWSEKVIGPGL